MEKKKGRKKQGLQTNFQNFEKIFIGEIYTKHYIYQIVASF